MIIYLLKTTYNCFVSLLSSSRSSSRISRRSRCVLRVDALLKKVLKSSSKALGTATIGPKTSSPSAGDKPKTHL